MNKMNGRIRYMGVEAAKALNFKVALYRKPFYLLCILCFKQVLPFCVELPN